MENQFSKFKSINFKEAVLGLIVSIGVALLDLAWQGANPFIVNLQKTGSFDFSLFTSVVNFESALDISIAAAMVYYPTIFLSGKKQKE